jgi:hypothetical protein
MEGMKMNDSYIVGNAEKTEFVGIDEASGGYPFMSSYLGGAEIFRDIDRAILFAKDKYLRERGNILFVYKIELTNV